jgi:hypothetical protein
MIAAQYPALAEGSADLPYRAAAGVMSECLRRGLRPALAEHFAAATAAAAAGAGVAAGEAGVGAGAGAGGQQQCAQQRQAHLLGFDVILDSAGRAHLLEVNHKPSIKPDRRPDDALLIGDLLRLALREGFGERLGMGAGGGGGDAEELECRQRFLDNLPGNGREFSRGKGGEGGERVVGAWDGSMWEALDLES